MTAKNKTDKSAKKPAGSSRKPADELYEDGDIATPKRDFNEDEIKEEEDKRL